MGEIEQSAGDQLPRFVDPAPFAAEVPGMRLEFFPGGADRRRALIHLIESAKESISMCFYIFAEDETGCAVRDALLAARQRGVAVSLILDGFGAEASDAFFAELAGAGAQVRRFSARWNVRYLIRNHQKIVIADGKRAMIGGFNVENSYFDPPESNGWTDLGVVLEGDAVSPLCRWFEELEKWTGDPARQWGAIRKAVREWDSGTGRVRWLVGGPTKGLSSWARSVSQDLMAGNRLDMMMAYFSPARRLIRRIGAMARRGEVNLMMAGKTDNAATLGASRILYKYLLKRGANIWEFQAARLHSKLLVIDDAVYLGSANFDMRSLYLNLEIALRVEDAALAEQVRALIAAHRPFSEHITLENHARRNTLWNRIRWAASWFLVSVADYNVTRRLNLGLK